MRKSPIEKEIILRRPIMNNISASVESTSNASRCQPTDRSKSFSPSAHSEQTVNYLLNKSKKKMTCPFIGN